MERIAAAPGRAAFRIGLAISSLLVLAAAVDLGGFRADFL